MDRRKFLTHFSLGWLASWTGGLLATVYSGVLGRFHAATAATPDSTRTATMKASLAGFVKAGTVKDLDEKGSLKVKGKNGSAVIVRDSQNSKTLYAMNSACTHKGCAVDWNAKSKQLICPCHASAFKVDGSVQKGPATKPLKKYEAKIEGSDVLIKWS